MINPTMYLIRAMPGSGKSSLIKKLNLTSNTISLDTFRELFSGLTMSNNGSIGIDQSYNQKIMYHFNSALECRLKEGVSFCVDNLNLKVSDINKATRFAMTYGYDVKVVDFELMPFKFYLDRNKGREVRKQLPISSLERLYASFEKTSLDGIIADVISVLDFEKEMSITIEDLSVDLNEFNQVKIVGDICGAGKALEELFEDEYFASTFYVFTGNYFDGCNEQNEVLLKLLSLSMAHKNNVVFLEGAKDTVYKQNTDKNKIDFGGLSKKALPDFMSMLSPYFSFKFKKEKYFISHAGVSSVPEKPYLINKSTFINRSFDQAFDVDEFFNKNENKGWIQLHGGRGVSKENDTKSISLAGNVELGGNLEAILLKQNTDLKGAEREYLSVKNQVPSKKALDGLMSRVFENFKPAKLVKYQKINNKKGLEKVNFGDAERLIDGNLFYTFYEKDLFSIEEFIESELPFITFNDVERVVFGYSKKRKAFICLDSKGEEKDFNLKDFDIKLLDIVKDFNSRLVCYIDAEKIVPVEGYRNDVLNNKIKASFFKNPIKMLHFKDVKSFNAFKLGIEKSGKEYYMNFKLGRKKINK